MKNHKGIRYLLVFIVFILIQISTSKVQAASLTPNLNSSAYNSNNIFTSSGYKGQCTWFVYGRALEKLNIKLSSSFYGNAIDWWSNNVKNKVYNYGSEPKTNSIAVWSGGSVGNGHVAFIENVVVNSVYFDEANFSYRGKYQGYLEELSKDSIKNRGNVFIKGYIYITEKYNSPSSNTSSSSSTVFISSGQVKLANRNSVLSVRKGAGTSFSMIGGLLNTNNVSILAKTGDWYKIKFDNTTGYVCADYVTIKAASVKHGTVKLANKNSKLNVRVSPNGKVSNSLSYGNTVTIVNKDGSFYKITCGKISGYASINYIVVS